MKFPTNRLPSWTLATWLFIISLFLHISLVLVLRHYKNPTLWENGGIAEYVFAGKGLSFDFSRPGEPTSWQAPGYPYLLAFFWHLFGFKTSAGHLCISLLQALAVASMIYPMSSLTERWFGPRAAKWAAIIVCLMPLYLWYPTRLHHTAFVMAMHPWLLWSWVCVADRGRVPHIVAAGVGTGLCALFQPVLLAIYGPLSCAFVLAAAFKKSWGQFSRFLAAGILTLIVLTPWTVRNWNVHGRLLLVKNSFGKELWMGNNPHATGTGYAVGGETEITNAYPPKSMELRGKVSEMELMDALEHEATQYIRAEPASFIQRTAKKVWWLWTAVPMDLSRSTHGGEARKFGLIHKSYWFLFIALTVTARVIGGRWKPEYFWILALYSLVYSLVYGLTHVGQARYRGEIEFVFIPAVAAGCVLLWQRFSSPDGGNHPG